MWRLKEGVASREPADRCRCPRSARLSRCPASARSLSVRIRRWCREVQRGSRREGLDPASSPRPSRSSDRDADVAPQARSGTELPLHPASGAAHRRKYAAGHPRRSSRSNMARIGRRRECQGSTRREARDRRIDAAFSPSLGDEEAGGAHLSYLSRASPTKPAQSTEESGGHRPPTRPSPPLSPRSRSRRRDGRARPLCGDGGWGYVSASADLRHDYASSADESAHGRRPPPPATRVKPRLLGAERLDP